jgi:hypothetical protein
MFAPTLALAVRKNGEGGCDTAEGWVDLLMEDEDDGALTAGNQKILVQIS